MRRGVRRRRPRSSAICFMRSAICSSDASVPSSERISLTRAARSESALHPRQTPARVRRRHGRRQLAQAQGLRWFQESRPKTCRLLQGRGDVWRRAHRQRLLNSVERACRTPARPIHAVNQVPVRKRQTESRSRPAPRLRPKGNSPAAVAWVSPCAKSLYCGHFSRF